MLRAVVLLALLAAAPHALAQDPVDLLELEVEPLGPPLGVRVEERVVNVTARVSCALMDSPISGMAVRLEVASAPAWADVVVDPASHVVGVQACRDGRVVLGARLHAWANESAPAFEPGEIVVRASAGEGARAREESASTPVEAAFWSVLDVHLERTIVVAAPGAEVEFPVGVANHGNAPVRVAFALVRAGDDLAVTVPEPLRLGSAVGNASADAAGTAVLRVRAPQAFGYTNQPASVTLRITSHHAERPELAGPEDQVTVLLTTKGWSATPAPPPALLLAVLVGLALAARRR